MSNLLQKGILSFLSALIVFFSFAPYFSVKAAPSVSTPPPPTSTAPSAVPTGTWYNSNFSDWFSKVYDPAVSPESEIFGERYTAAQVQWVFYGFMAMIVNNIITPELTSCFLTNSTNLKTCAGLLSSANLPATVATKESGPKPSLLSLVFADRPFSGISYVKEKISNFSLVPVAHAQTVGFGFTALKVVQTMWTASRNIAFGLFVLAAIIFAFMIMFRVKISPQVVITVQSAIPKLIIALILVTFSYAIAGFLIDLMYVVYGILSIVGGSFLSFVNPDPSTIFQFLTAGRLGSGGFGVDTGVFGLVGLYLIIFPLALGITLFTTLGVLPSLITSVLAGLATVILAPFAGFFIILGVIILVIACIILIWHVVKIIWTLLKAYVNILLLTIFAPLHIVSGLFVPSLGFGSWVKSFVSNLAVFVVTSMLIFFAFVFLLLGVKTGLDSIAGSGTTLADFLFKIFLGSSLTSAISGFGTPSSWPPLLGSSGTGGGVGGSVGLLLLGVSFVMFTLIPKASEIIASFISGKPFAYGSAISETATGVLTTAAAAQKYGPAFIESIGKLTSGFRPPRPPTAIRAGTPPTP